MTSFRFRWLGLLLALWAGWGQGDAFAQRVYWTDALNGKIQSANTDGTDVTTVFDTMTVLPEGFTHPARPAFLLVDPVEGWIYWTDLWSGVHRVKLDGTGHENILPVSRVTIPEHTFFPNRTTTILDRADIQGIALDPVSKLLYWGPDHPYESPLDSPFLSSPGEGGHVRVSNPDGTAVADIHNTGVDGYTSALALDLDPSRGGKMYFSSPTSNNYPTSNRIYRTNLDGSARELFYEGPYECDPRDIKVDEAAGTVYWNCFWAGAIMQQNVNGSENKILAYVSGPGGIALDPGNSKIYVLESDAGRVTRRNLADGTLDSDFTIVTASEANPQPRQMCGTDVPNVNAPCPFYPQGIALDLTARPDMIISSFSAASTVDAGADITVTDTTRNKGTAQAGETTNYIYFSTDATLDPGDKLLGSGSVGVLETGSASSDSTTVKIPETAAQPDLIVSALSAPTTAAAGATITVTETTEHQSPHLIVVADGEKALLELNETNNTSTQPITVNGSQAAASTTRVYFSLDATLDGNDTQIFEHAVTALDAGSSHPVSFAFQIPPTTASGIHYLIAVADADSIVAESNETNNTRIQPITVADSLPDLVVSEFNAPTSAAAGDSITVTETTKNQHDAEAGTSKTKVYLSLDAKLDF